MTDFIEIFLLKKVKIHDDQAGLNRVYLRFTEAAHKISQHQFDEFITSRFTYLLTYILQKYNDNTVIKRHLIMNYYKELNGLQMKNKVQLKSALCKAREKKPHTCDEHCAY